MYIPQFIYSSIAKYLVCACVLAIANSAAMNIGIQYLWDPVFCSSGCIPRSEIAESYVSSIFNLLRNHYTVFHSGCAVFHSHQTVHKSSIFWGPSPTLAFFFFFLKLFKLVDFKILPRTVLHHTYSLRTGLISFLCARDPFLEVKTFVSHIQSKMRHRTELFRTLWNTIWQRRCFSSSNMSSH